MNINTITKPLSFPIIFSLMPLMVYLTTIASAHKYLYCISAYHYFDFVPPVITCNEAIMFYYLVAGLDILIVSPLNWHCTLMKILQALPL